MQSGDIDILTVKGNVEKDVTELGNSFATCNPINWEICSSRHGFNCYRYWIQLQEDWRARPKAQHEKKADTRQDAWQLYRYVNRTKEERIGTRTRPTSQIPNSTTAVPYSTPSRPWSTSQTPPSHDNRPTHRIDELTNHRNDKQPKHHVDT